MGGPVGGGLAAWWPIFLIAGLILLALAVAGGALAGAAAGRRSGFVLGVVAYVATAWTLRVRWDVAGERSLLLGFAGSLVVGLGLAAAGRVDEQRRTAALVAVWAVSLAGVGLAVRSTVAHEAIANARDATRAEAEQIAAQIERSPARTGDALAFASGADVVEARGDRRDGGAELVVRVTRRSFGHDPTVVCWRYRISGRSPTVVPEAASCPGPAPVVAGNYGDNLASFVLDLPGDGTRTAETVRPAVERAVDIYVEGDADVEVGDLGPDVIGVALRLSVTRCTFTRIEGPGSEARFTTWQADPDRIGPGSAGCHPEGAVP